MRYALTVERQNKSPPVADWPDLPWFGGGPLITLRRANRASRNGHGWHLLVEMAAAPFVERVKAPRARPTGLTGFKCRPESAHGLTVKVLSQRWRKLEHAGAHLGAPCAAHPMLPRQCEGSLALPGDARGKQIAQRLGKQRLANARAVFHTRRKAGDVLHK